MHTLIKLTSGEKLIWAAVFAESQRAFIDNIPFRKEMLRDATEHGIRCARKAILELRKFKRKSFKNKDMLLDMVREDKNK